MSNTRKQEDVGKIAANAECGNTGIRVQYGTSRREQEDVVTGRCLNLDNSYLDANLLKEVLADSVI